MQPKIYLAPFYLIAASLVGLGDTLYLAYNHVMGVVPGCVILNGCELVLNSPYSKFFEVPLAYIGLVFYVYMLGLALLLAFDPTSRGLRWGTLVYSAVGLGFSVFFELFQYYVIHALCMYCAISALVSAVLFCVAVWHFISSKQQYA